MNDVLLSVGLDLSQVDVAALQKRVNALHSAIGKTPSMSNANVKQFDSLAANAGNASKEIQNFSKVAGDANAQSQVLASNTARTSQVLVKQGNAQSQLNKTLKTAAQRVKAITLEEEQTNVSRSTTLAKMRVYNNLQSKNIELNNEQEQHLKSLKSLYTSLGQNKGLTTLSAEQSKLYEKSTTRIKALTLAESDLGRTQASVAAKLRIYKNLQANNIELTDRQQRHVHLLKQAYTSIGNEKSLTKLNQKQIAEQNKLIRTYEKAAAQLRTLVNEQRLLNTSNKSVNASMSNVGAKLKVYNKITSSGINLTNRQQRHLSLLKQRYTELGQAVKKTHGPLVDFGKTVSKAALWATTWTVLYAAIRLVTTGISDVVQDTIKLNEAMARIKVVTTSASGDIQASMKALGSTLQAYVATMPTTLEAASEALFKLSTAHLNSKEAAEALAPVLDLVIISTKDLNEQTELASKTAEVAAGIYNNYKDQMDASLSTGEKFRKITAAMAQTFADQQVELQELGDGLKYTITTFSQAGVSVDALIAYLGVLNTNYVKSTRAGTGLNRMMVKMVENSDKLAEYFDIAIDPSKPVDFLSILTEMNKRIKASGNSAQSLADIYDIMGIRAGPANKAVLRGLEEIEKQMKLNETAVDRMEEKVRVKTESMKGQWLLFTNQVSAGFRLNFLEGFLDLGTDVVGVLTKIAQALNVVNAAVKALAPEMIMNIFNPLLTLGSKIDPFKKIINKIFNVEEGSNSIEDATRKIKIFLGIVDGEEATEKLKDNLKSGAEQAKALRDILGEKYEPLSTDDFDKLEKKEREAYISAKLLINSYRGLSSEMNAGAIYAKVYEGQIEKQRKSIVKQTSALEVVKNKLKELQSMNKEGLGDGALKNRERDMEVLSAEIENGTNEIEKQKNKLDALTYSYKKAEAIKIKIDFGNVQKEIDTVNELKKAHDELGVGYDTSGVKLQFYLSEFDKAVKTKRKVSDEIEHLNHLLDEEQSKLDQMSKGDALFAGQEEEVQRLKGSLQEWNNVLDVTNKSLEDYSKNIKEGFAFAEKSKIQDSINSVQELTQAYREMGVEFKSAGEKFTTYQDALESAVSNRAKILTQINQATAQLKDTDDAAAKQETLDYLDKLKKAYQEQTQVVREYQEATELAWQGKEAERLEKEKEKLKYTLAEINGATELQITYARINELQEKQNKTFEERQELHDQEIRAIELQAERYTEVNNIIKDGIVDGLNDMRRGTSSLQEVLTNIGNEMLDLMTERLVKEVIFKPVIGDFEMTEEERISNEYTQSSNVFNSGVDKFGGYVSQFSETLYNASVPKSTSSMNGEGTDIADAYRDLSKVTKESSVDNADNSQQFNDSATKLNETTSIFGSAVSLFKTAVGMMASSLAKSSASSSGGMGNYSSLLGWIGLILALNQNQNYYQGEGYREDGRELGKNRAQSIQLLGIPLAPEIRDGYSTAEQARMMLGYFQDPLGIFKDWWGVDAYEENIQETESTEEITSKIDITNKELQIVNRNLVALRQGFEGYVMQTSYYQRERQGMGVQQQAVEFAVNSQRGYL